MHDDVCAVLDRPQQYRRRHGIVDDEWNASTVCDARDRLEVADVARGIADGLAKYRACGFVDERVDVLRSVAAREARLNAIAAKGVGEQGMRGAI